MEKLRHLEHELYAYIEDIYAHLEELINSTSLSVEQIQIINQISIDIHKLEEELHHHRKVLYSVFPKMFILKAKACGKGF